MEQGKIIEMNKKIMLLRRGIMHHLLMNHGLHPGQPEMLYYVSAHPGCSQRQIAEEAGVSAASVAASFKRMENAGFIRRRSDTADLRCNRVYITERGEAALSGCEEELKLMNRRMLESLSSEDIEVFCRCLDTIAKNLLQLRQE